MLCYPVHKNFIFYTQVSKLWFSLVLPIYYYLKGFFFLEKGIKRLCIAYHLKLALDKYIEDINMWQFKILLTRIFD